MKLNNFNGIKLLLKESGRASVGFSYSIASHDVGKIVINRPDENSFIYDIPKDQYLVWGSSIDNTKMGDRCIQPLLDEGKAELIGAPEMERMKPWVLTIRNRQTKEIRKVPINRFLVEQEIAKIDIDKYSFKIN